MSVWYGLHKKQVPRNQFQFNFRYNHSFTTTTAIDFNFIAEQRALHAQYTVDRLEDSTNSKEQRQAKKFYVCFRNNWVDRWHDFINKMQTEFCLYACKALCMNWQNCHLSASEKNVAFSTPPSKLEFFRHTNFQNEIPCISFWISFVNRAEMSFTVRSIA